jgi:glycine hydroxymethyltransferase
MKIAIGSDHGGFKIKEFLRSALSERGAEVVDVGCHSDASVDYPDYAREVALKVARGETEQGLLVCTTGIGMAIAANKFPQVRAALCLTPDMASTARTHNNANVLVLGGKFVNNGQAGAILDAWLANKFPDVERHVRRVGKIGRLSAFLETDAVFEEDPETARAIENETLRQERTINLIASENHVTRAVRQAQGCLMTNKYAEGYPGKRWYSGCDFVDVVEQLAIDRARELFGADHANVQPHCGSSANMGVYFAALEPGDTILAMSLAHGGHLTHGHNVNFSGRLYNVVSYGVSREDECIDYDEVAGLAREHKPRLIVAGASAYPRILDFERLRAAADEVGARLMVDMAHIAGLVAGGVHPSPVPFAEYVTTTTHKTLRGPRSGMVLCREPFAGEVDRQVFPGMQGGPQMHTIAAKAVCFHEALRPDFKDYAAQIVKNAKAMAEVLAGEGFRLVSGGTENHLMLVDLSVKDMTGKDAAAALDRAGIIVNKNAIPFDKQSPFVTSGIRVGTPAVTTRGMREAECRLLAERMVEVLRDIGDTTVQERVRGEMQRLGAEFPVP